MELKDFVANTLVEICEGVTQAQGRLHETGVRVNPALARGNITKVEFDVEVSTSDGSASKSGIGVFVGGLGAGAQDQSHSKRGAVGRIKFEVPMAMPVTDGRTRKAVQ